MKTVRTAELPPFFTQVIGSLPRPQAVRDLLAKRGEFPPDRFRQLLDAYVLFAIRLQEQVGLDVIRPARPHRQCMSCLAKIGTLILNLAVEF